MENKSGEEALVSCETTKGPVVMRMYRDWSPHGYDRVVDLFERGFYDDSHLFRCVPKFLCQFGITYSEDKELRKLMHKQIPDDPQLNPPISFDLGTMSFAGSGPDSRTSQIFIAYGKNRALGTNPWETPFGQVVEGIENAISWYSYGDMPPWGKGPKQGKIYGGPDYINENFPLIDKIEKCTVRRIPARDDTGGEAKDAVEQEVEAIPEEVEEPARANLRRIKEALLVSETDASALTAPENEIVLAVVFLLAVILICLFRGRRKSESKTQ